MLPLGMKFFLLYMFHFLQLGGADTTKRIQSEFLPKGKLVPTFTADTRAHRLGAARNFDEHSYNVSMGGIFPVYEFGNTHYKIQVSAAGSTYLTLVKNTVGGSVQNIDFFGDGFVDLNFHRYWTYRIGMGHSSQHLSDDAIVAGNPFKNYAKDYFQLTAIFQFPRYHINTYGGLYYNYNFKTNTDISGKLLFQFGFEHAPFKLSPKAQLYYAGDIKIREENDYAFTTNLQVGYKLVNSLGKTLRLALNYTSGTDERGYYQPANRNFAHAGIYLDF